MTIVFIRANHYNATPAIPRAIEAVEGLFSRIYILAWNRHGIVDSGETGLDSSIIIKRFMKTAPPRHFKIVLFTIWFQFWVFWNIIKIKASVVHVLELECAIPVVIGQIINKYKIIYDMRDPFALVYKHNRIIKKLSHTIDKIIMMFCDGFVLPNSALVSYLYSDKKPIIIIPNTCHDFFDELRSKCDLVPDNPEKINIAYMGYMTVERGAEWLIELSKKNVECVRLIVVGLIRSKALLKSLQQLPNATYLGRVPYHKALEIIKSSDIVPLLYDPQIPVHKLMYPTKFYEALMAGTPVLVSKGMTLLENIVRDNGLGITINFGNNDEFITSIKKLKNNITVKSLCRSFYQKNLDLSLFMDNYTKFYKQILSTM